MKQETGHKDIHSRKLGAQYHQYSQQGSPYLCLQPRKEYCTKQWRLRVKTKVKSKCKPHIYVLWKHFTYIHKIIYTWQWQSQIKPLDLALFQNYIKKQHKIIYTWEFIFLYIAKTLQDWRTQKLRWRWLWIVFSFHSSPLMFSPSFIF